MATDASSLPMTTAVTPSVQVAVALLGARCHYAVPNILQQQGMLSALYTDIYSDDWPAQIVNRFVPRRMVPSAAKRLTDRKIPGIPAEKIHTYPLFALRRAWSHSRRRTSGAVLSGYAVDNARFCRRVLRTGLGQAQAIYVFNGAGLEIMQFARKHGVATIHEQTIAPYSMVEPLLESERSLWPDWEQVNTSHNEWQALADREHREWALADTIVCGSSFVADGVRKQLHNPSANCVVVPYGVDLPAPGHQRSAVVNRPLRVLYLGTVELRKGIQYLTQAAEKLSQRPIQFRAVGPIRISDAARRRVSRHIDMIGPVPRSMLMEHLDWADIFVLPTLAEGSAIVVYEALAAGLPVITTPNAGSVLRDGIEGFLVPIRDPNAIVEKLERLLDEPQLLGELSAAALMRARDFTVQWYGERLLNVFRGLQS